MSATSLGPVNWSLQRDDDGHRTYMIDFKVITTSVGDGPASVTWASGLPTVGSYWNYGNDLDIWAFCWPTMTVTPIITDEPGYFWKVTCKFTTKPFKRCQDTSIEDPLLEPPRLRGGFNTRTKETTKDRHGKLIKSSSHEIISGIEKDFGGATVSVDINVASFDLEEFCEAMHKVNDAALWGMDARHIKCMGGSWVRNLYGVCSYYFTVSYEFEARENGWDDDDIADAGYKCLRGKWVESGTSTAYPPHWEEEAGLDPDDPDNFIVAKDANDESMPKMTLLNGSGGRLTDPDNPVFIDPVEHYDEFNFLSLGIPSSLTE